MHQRMLSWVGEQGPEAVIPLTRTPRASSLFEHVANALGVSTPRIGPFNVLVVNGGPEAGEQVKVALLRAQEQMETMLEDILRRHRSEQFA